MVGACWFSVFRSPRNVRGSQSYGSGEKIARGDEKRAPVPEGLVLCRHVCRAGGLADAAAQLVPYISANYQAIPRLIHAER